MNPATSMTAKRGPFCLVDRPVGDDREVTLLPMFHDVVALFTSIADDVGEMLTGVTDWGPSGQREGQYAADVVADRVVLEALMKEGLSVLSEESGLTIRRRSELVVVDPLD